MAFVASLPMATKCISSSITSKKPTNNYCSKKIRAQPTMGIRAVESFDGSFTLATEVKDALSSMLLDNRISSVVAKQAKRETAEFTGVLFQPVPYSKETPHGMPQDIEQYHKNPGYVIINVPPQVMFNAKCYKPPRLCAVFQLMGEQVEESASNVQDEWSNVGDAFRNPAEDGNDLDKYIV